jgi:hypothetical protein
MNILRCIFGFKDKPAETKPVAIPEADTKTAAVPTGRVSEVLRPFLAFMEGMSESLATERIELLTLRDAIRRFVEGKPKQCEPVKGALIVQPHREGKLVLWAFLDSDNSVMRGDDCKPLGRKAICGTLDDELTAMLGERELLIVE